jgi:signal transduction histidine kinase
MVGLLYLENNLVAGAFTPDRLIALELLATQAAISLDNARSYLERKQAEGALRDREEWLRLAIEATELGTFDYYPIGGKIISSERNSINLGRPVGTEMNYASFLACLCPDERPRVDKLVQQALDPDGPGLYDVEYRVMWPTGQTHWVKAKGRVFFAEIDGVRRAIRFTGTTMDITQQKQAEAAIKDLTDTLERRVAQRTRELQEAQQELVEAARRAGMAEIAVNVLHNVGNVLNSVNVSASVANGLVRASRIQRLPQLARLLRERDDLPTFLTQDPKGRQVPLYLSQVAEQLEHERTMLMDNLASITKNIDHIKSIVQVQQSYAGWVGVAEYVCPATILADALSINAAGAEPRPIEVVQDYEDIPPLRLDKHKILQILINLISNAQYALRQSTVEHPRLILRLRRVGPRRIRIEVADNGVGIPKENLTRIFQHGFTTRPGGHGFGLHSGALAARALGGSLTVESAGVGHGATFALEVVAEEPAPPRRLSDKADVGPGV